MYLHILKGTHQLIDIYSKGTNSVNHTPFSDKKNSYPSSNIFPAAIIITIGFPCLLPTLVGVSTSQQFLVVYKPTIIKYANIFWDIRL